MDSLHINFSSWIIQRTKTPMRFAVLMAGRDLDGKTQDTVNLGERLVAVWKPRCATELQPFLHAFIELHPHWYPDTRNWGIPLVKYEAERRRRGRRLCV